MIKEKIHVAGILMENNKGEILAVLRSKKEEIGGNTWAPVGGEIEKGESKEDTIVREIKEECGLKVDKHDVVFLKTIKIDYDEFKVKFETFRIKIDERKFKIRLRKSEATKYIWEKPEDLYSRDDLLYGFYKVLEGIYHFS